MLNYELTLLCTLCFSSVSRVAFGNPPREEMIVVLSDRTGSLESDHGGSLVDGFQDSAVPPLPATVTTPAAELLMLDKPTVTPGTSLHGGIASHPPPWPRFSLPRSSRYHQSPSDSAPAGCAEQHRRDVARTVACCVDRDQCSPEGSPR
jgi:hypothetical protein